MFFHKQEKRTGEGDNNGYGKKVFE